MLRKGTGTARRGPQRKEPFGGEYETPLDVPVRHGGGGVRGASARAWDRSGDLRLADHV